jgi:hypothetical protein
VVCARAVLAVLVVALFTGLTPTAFADPPDSTWTAGYWDDYDFDDAIVFLTALAAIRLADGESSSPSRLLPVAPAAIDDVRH